MLRTELIFPAFSGDPGGRPYLRDLIRDVVRSVFDLRRDDGLLGGRRRRALLVVVGLGEVERDEGDLVDGAVAVEVGVGGGAEEAGLDVAERP